MAQVNSGIRKVLNIPDVYSLFQKVIGSEYARELVVREYLKPFKNMRLLDVGCGPADILDHLDEGIYYKGFDLDASYIEKAKMKYGSRGSFVCMDVSDFEFDDKEPKFDRILITGVLHHLDDQQIEKLFSVLCRLLNPNGFLLATENTFVEQQSNIARWIISKDRGKNVRTPEGYLGLCRKYFKTAECQVRHDLLYIPYTHAIIICKND